MRGLKVQGGCNMIPKIIVRPNYFPLWWCDNINKHMLNNVEVDKEFGRKGVRRCDVRMLTPKMRPFNDVFNSLLNFTKQHLTDLNVDIDYKIDGAIQHITYLPGHHVGWHDDTMSVHMAKNSPQFMDLKTDRKLSLTVMLSDPIDYTGGEFEFEQGFELPSKVEGKGTAALFTSYSQHRVTEIKSGVRNILFIFLTGPVWK